MKKVERNMMTTAMAELMFTDPDYLERGVPPGKLLKAMSIRENAAYSRKDLEEIIQRELDSGDLVKMENGNYALRTTDTDQDSMDMDSFNADSNPKLTSSNNSSSSSPLRVKGKPGRKKCLNGSKATESQPVFYKNDDKRVVGIRVGERHKRAKKVFDPSDNNPPIAKKKKGKMGIMKGNGKKSDMTLSTKGKGKYESDEGDSSGDEEKEIMGIRERDKIVVTGGVCSVCRQHKNGRDTSGKLVSCRDCSNKAHVSCLRGGDGMLRLRPDNTWQCPHCKTCVVCIETNDAGLLTVCSVCADAYHTLCHSPPIPERLKAWDQWECKNCQETKNTPTLDATYIEKIPSGSEHSSKNSDKSDSRRSNEDRRRDKSSRKSVDSDDRHDKLIIAERDDRSRSPPSADSEWKPSSKKRNSPNNKKSNHDWKHNGRKSSDVDEKKSKNSDTRQSNKVAKSKLSIYMDNYESNKWHTVSTYQKHPNDRGAPLDDEIDTSIPNAEKWNNSDVYQYFASYFPEEARVFKEQDIDGKSLMLMRRNDLVHSFGLPLGPALKVYRHVVKLQTRKDDFSMCWV